MTHSHLFTIVLAGLLSVGIALLSCPCEAEIYKYKKDGVWVYTDTPTESMPTDHKKLTDSKASAVPPPSPDRQLLANYPAANAIEKAAGSTVAISTALGSGSGFFISTNGHILTNKHVIRTTSKQTGQTADQISQIEAQITTAANRLSNEKKRIQNYKAHIDQLKKVTARVRDKVKKEAYRTNYEAKLANYRQWTDDYNQRSRKFEAGKKQFETNRSNFEYARTITNLSQSFTITLADNTQLYARVIAVSAEHDLALLKLDGYQTPSLSPAADQMVAQGDPVYAIGNPANLKNSVTAGVFSGREGMFIKTNAQIYPGNSGGPLISKTGHVIGINTFKKLTHKFEGLGFAIPIQQALRAFSAHLP